MLRLRNLSNQIMQIYKESQDSFSAFQKKTGLNCLEGCGACCLSKEVSASVLEMIPTALHLYDQKFAEDILTQLDSLDEDTPCLFYIKNSSDGSFGRCSNYEFRPSVCRSFGAGAVLDKQGRKTLSLCKLIKKNIPSEDKKIINPETAPVIGSFARRVLLLETSKENLILPINSALKEAIKKVLLIASLDQE